MGEYGVLVTLVLGAIIMIVNEARNSKKNRKMFWEHIYPKYDRCPDKIIWMIWRNGKLDLIDKHKYVAVFIGSDGMAKVAGSDDLDALAAGSGNYKLKYLIRDKEYVRATKSIVRTITINE